MTIERSAGLAKQLDEAPMAGMCCNGESSPTVFVTEIQLSALPDQFGADGRVSFKCSGHQQSPPVAVDKIGRCTRLEALPEAT